MAKQITCSDSECRFYEDGVCVADAVDHTSDRFCTTGRRKPRDTINNLMQVQRPGCHRQGGYKSDRVRAVK